MKMIKSLGKNQSALRITIIDMRHQFGVTSSAIKEGSDYLVEHGYMIRNKPTKTKGKGCSTEYVFQDKLFKLLRTVEANTNNADVVEELMLPDIERDKKRRFELNQSQRLLLATMFGLASNSGLLHDVSISKLSKLTGMSYTRVKSQLKYLYKYCFIRYCQNGGALEAWGIKVKSRYILNFSKFKTTVTTVLPPEFLRQVMRVEAIYNSDVFDGLVSPKGSKEFYLWKRKVEEFAHYYLNDHDSDLNQKNIKIRDELRLYFHEIVKSFYPAGTNIQAKLRQIVNATAMQAQFLSYVIIRRWEDTPIMMSRSTVHSIIGYLDAAEQHFLIESYGELINAENSASIEKAISDQPERPIPTAFA
ncbi:hypothetical protein TUM4644_34500 [Shewanella colwelliana]|uniref:hypothetical protein n=1 Tax=Shewanella colwelliana TaxID=23 RepID=UPI001BC01ADD|nr:hypothetical protein [Shewanella colwelliana]GIU33626.1 hypothetical protein TUM4644_34500 [Shewanella colwelliana]